MAIFKSLFNHSIIKKYHTHKYVNEITLFISYIALIGLMLLNLVLQKFINAYDRKRRQYELDAKAGKNNL